MFKKLSNTSIETLFILFMWLSALSTFSYALLTNYLLNYSDILGLVSLVVLSLINTWKKEYTFYFLLGVLFIGMLNLFSFVYFFNYFIAFSSIVIQITPGIQIYSLVLFFTLITLRRQKIRHVIRLLSGTTEEDLVSHTEFRIAYYKKRFDKLSDEEIARKLASNLSEEAIIALHAIQYLRRKSD